MFEMCCFFCLKNFNYPLTLLTCTTIRFLMWLIYQTDLKVMMVNERTYVWKAISLNVKLSFTPSDVSSSPAFSNVSILNMNHLSFTPTLFPFPSLFLSLPICLLSCKTLWCSPLICAWHVPFIFLFFNSQ